MTEVKVFEWEGGESTERGEFVVTDIEFFDLGEFFEFGEGGEVVVGEYEYFEMGELGHEGEFLDFEIGEIGKLEYRGVLDFKFSNIELLSALEHKIFIEFIVEIGS